jgi:hypothetical protein
VFQDEPLAPEPEPEEDPDDVNDLTEADRAAAQAKSVYFNLYAGNTKGGSIIVPLASCLTGLD